MTPLVSLYIPTRGRPELLERALKSALAQTYSHLEVLVVVDGPDPETQKALDTFQDDPRLKILPQAVQGGACRARNAAISAAEGELITGLDDDDELLEGHIETLVRALLERNVPFVATTSIVIRQSGPLIRHAFQGRIGLEGLLRENIVGNQALTHTSYLRALGGFDPEMPAWQDYDLWVRLASRYGPGFRIDARTYLQHQDHGYERISARERILEAQKEFVRKHAALLTPKQVASLELLARANSHDPLTFIELVRFSRAGFPHRAVIAFLAENAPFLRRVALRLREVARRLRS